MKIMSKAKIIRKNSVKNINNERKFLSLLNNPFLVNMFCSFQDNENLYLVMDLLLGGDMRYHINKRAIYNRRKDESQLKFVAGCALIGLNYIHENNIIHKDIKPENFVYDSKGYLHITDFGISKLYHQDNWKENSGTPGYMAPEVLFNKNHDFCVDFFSLGVCLYELLIGRRPYHGHSKKDLRKDIISRQARVKEEKLPEGFIKSKDFNNCVDFINSLLERKKDKRLGKNGFLEIKCHPWFADFNWDELYCKKMEPSFIPPHTDNNYDKNYCNEEEKIGKDTQKEYDEIKSKDDYNKFFENYSYNTKIRHINQSINSNKKFYSLRENSTKKNTFDMSKNISDLIKDKIFVRTVLKNNEQSQINNNTSETKNINSLVLSNINNINNNHDDKVPYQKMNLNSKEIKSYKSNNINEISLSTKINSNLSTSNVLSEHFTSLDKKVEKFKLQQNGKVLKDQNSMTQYHNFYNSAYVNNSNNNNHKTKIYFSISKNGQNNKKLPFIYKHFKKSVSVGNFLGEKKYSKNKFSHNDKLYNPNILYAKYFQSKKLEKNRYFPYFNLK